MTHHILVSLFTCSMFVSSFGCSFGLPLALIGASSKHVRFVAGEVSAKQPVWFSDTALLDRWSDLSGDLIFILENPTDHHHTFTMPGIQVITGERIATPESHGDIVEPIAMVSIAPLSVIVKPGESRHVRIHATDLRHTKSTGMAFRYFCTIHRDVRQAGSLYLI